MQTAFINIILAFFEGFALIISPCILPILPIILSGSLDGSKKRPLGIITGFVLTFVVLTLFSRQLIHYTGIDLTAVRHVSYALLIILGIIMLSTYLTEKFTRWTQSLTNIGSSLKEANNPEGGFSSGVFFGGLVGIIWTPCAGPILAAVIVQTVLQQTTVLSFLTILFFGIGAAVPMLIIAIFGRKIMSHFGFFRTHAMVLRKILGAIIIAAVVYMIISEGMLGTPSFAKTDSRQTMIVNGVMAPYPAPDFKHITAWINSSPLEISQLKGKVVLIDFWTYSCINCVRAIPYLIHWYNQYHNHGLEIVGVHSPEFAFERDFNNVKNAVQKMGITYPVALDNDFATWLNYQNRYWPAHYLIDKNGYVVYQHFGEGEYNVTENNIRYLLGMTATDYTPTLSETASGNQTPETYLGYQRIDRFMSREIVQQNRIAQYSFPPELGTDQWAIQGNWIVAAEKITSAGKGASVKIHFNAKKVYVVMGIQNKKPIKVQMFLNGESLVSAKGKDVVDSAIVVNKNTLYEAVSFKKPEKGVLLLRADAPGLELYTFTFG